MGDIDLDLVELRCKLREWKYERTHADPDGSGWSLVLDIDTPEGRVWCRDDDERGGFNCGLIDPVLFVPRLTLADIIAAPGEGWRAGVAPDKTVFFWWQPSTREKVSDVRVDVTPEACLRMPPLYRTHMTTPDLLAAHRAVVALLVRLGEVTT